MNSLPESYFRIIRWARYTFVALSGATSLLALVLIKLESQQMSQRYSAQLSAIVVSSYLTNIFLKIISKLFSFLADIVMHTIWDPFIFHPIPCGVRLIQCEVLKIQAFSAFRHSPVLRSPGSYDNYFVRIVDN